MAADLGLNSVTGVDLGVISPRRAVLLDKETTRPDFFHFVVELKPLIYDPANIITLIKTNDLLTAADMAAAPSGRGVMGVKAVYSDGTESKVALYGYDLRRGTPATPSARAILILTTNELVRSLTNELRKVREVPVPPAPLPGIVPMPFNFGGGTTRTAGLLTNHFRGVVLFHPLPPPYPRPLPNSTNDSYSDFLDRVADARQRFRND